MSGQKYLVISADLDVGVLSDHTVGGEQLREQEGNGMSKNQHNIKTLQQTHLKIHKPPQ